jgi:hypothetical protein
MAKPPAGTDLKDDAIDRPLPMSNAWTGKAREFQQAVELRYYHYEALHKLEARKR